LRGKGITAEDRFWPLVLMVESCWEWVGHRNRQGYGKFWAYRKCREAHRWSYEHFVGPIPRGLTLDHLCRNPGCVNPSHLEPVTAKENSLRGHNPFADNARKTHCVHGHKLSGKNLKTPPSRAGIRLCRKCCNAMAMRRYYKRQAAGLPRKGAK
jgi:hypothetical protein